MRRAISKNTFSAISAFVIALAISYFFHTHTQQTVARVIINGEFLEDVNVVISNVTDGQEISLLGVLQAEGAPRGKVQRLGTQRFNRSIERLQIEVKPRNPNSNPSLIIIHNIQIEVPYGQDVFISDKNLSKHFSEGVLSLSSSNNIPITNAEGRLALLTKTNINQPSFVTSLGLFGLFLTSLFLIFRHVEFSKIPAFADMALGKEISSKREFEAVNGLRGIAALMVLFSHTAPGFEANGVGIAILFVISGFLLSKPFILFPESVSNSENIQNYLVKRIKRIIPMYYFYVFLTYAATLQIEPALRHFAFVQADGHLWPMTQIFCFYLMLPFILLFTNALFRLNKVTPILVLSLISYYWWTKMGDWKPFYNGRFHHEFYLYSFLLGVVASYIHYGVLSPNQSPRTSPAVSFSKMGTVGGLMLIFIILWSGPLQAPWVSLNIVVHQFFYKCVLAALIIILILNNRDKFWQSVIANRLFQSIGVVGFSFYLLHGIGMKLVTELQSQILLIENPSHRSWEFMALSFLVTYFLSIITYSLIERPFFGRRASSK